MPDGLKAFLLVVFIMGAIGLIIAHAFWKDGAHRYGRCMATCWSYGLPDVVACEFTSGEVWTVCESAVESVKLRVPKHPEE